MPSRDPKVLVMSCIFTVGLAASCGGKASINVDSGLAADGPANVNLDSSLAIDGPTGTPVDNAPATDGPVDVSLDSAPATDGPADVTLDSNLAIDGSVYLNPDSRLAIDGSAYLNPDSSLAIDSSVYLNPDSSLAIDSFAGLTGDTGEAGSSETGGPEANSEAGIRPGPGCPNDRPAGGDPCSLPSDSECAYDDVRCNDGSVLKAIYWCASGKWTGLGDLGCSAFPPPSPMCTAIAGPAGTCTDGEQCAFVAELCPGNEPLMGACTCSGGSWSGCRRSYDCNPPSTCLTPSGDCVTTGSQNWSAVTGWCPSGTTMGACQGHACRPGDVRPLCGQTGNPSRSAVCVYGQWACGLGYSLLAR